MLDSTRLSQWLPSLAVSLRLSGAAPATPIMATLVLALLLLGGGALTGCGADSSSSETSSSIASAATQSSSSSPSTRSTPSNLKKVAHKHKEGETAKRNPNERPVPAFKGKTLDGSPLAMRDLLGARVVLFFFNPEKPRAKPIAAAVNAVAAEAFANNFQVVGVGVGSTTPKLSLFAKEQALSFPVIDDSSANITRAFRLRTPLAMIGIDADGYMSFGIGGFAKKGDILGLTEKDLREKLRLPEAANESTGALFAYPDAPELGVISMADGAKLTTEELSGRAAIVIFFLHTCPHCHKALESIKATLESIPADQKPRLVAISIQNSPGAVRTALADLDLDFFDPYLDPGGKATDRWGVTGGVPVVTVVDAEGRIRHRSQGWNEKRHGALLRMQVAQAAGTRVPMLLDPKGYSGNDACGSCHQQEYATWQYTQHASAFSTLVTHTADRRTDCVGCHVVGFEEPGGYDFKSQPAHLENVGCESCHGRGGPHLSPGFVPPGDTPEERYATVCGTCHNETHSLGFEFASFHPRVSHTEIAGLSNRERAALLEGGGPARDLLPSTADYVGSDACQSCHEAEFKTWQAGPHGHAVETLAKEGKAAEAECLQCHTTAYGRTGGFPADAPVAEHPDLARVGCESCHGAGGDHIGENARRVGTIVSLGDKCDSCVILKICGSCHDDANDPGFQFKVEERIEAQRHGTTPSAATRALDEAALAPQSLNRPHDPAAHDRALLESALGSVAPRSTSTSTGTSASTLTSGSTSGSASESPSISGSSTDSDHARYSADSRLTPHVKRAPRVHEAG